MIKKFEQFVNEDLVFRNEFYNMYSQEDYEQLDEGFKEFFRKFALTTAIATSCITAFAKPIVAESPANVNKIQMEILTKAEEKVNKDCKIFAASSDSEEMAKQYAIEDFYATFGDKAKIVDTQIIQTVSMRSGRPLFKCIIIYTD